MSSRRSKTGSRSASRTRGASANGRSTSRGGSRSLSAGRRAGNNSRRAASTRHSSQDGRRGSARSKRSTRAGSSAPYAVKLLKQDHRAVAEALEEFESAARGEKRSIAQRICRMLTVHAQIEEELLYSSARGVLRADDAHLVAEANVEHASVKELIQQIEQCKEVDEEYEAKVQVMGEYVKHHVKEEETELFPKLERSSLDLDSLGERLEMRKAQLMGEEAEGHEGTDMQEESQVNGMGRGRSRAGRGSRPSSVHARSR
jgi:hemerythrin superfamily protein